MRRTLYFDPQVWQKEHQYKNLAEANKTVFDQSLSVTFSNISSDYINQRAIKSLYLFRYHIHVKRKNDNLLDFVP